MSELEVQDHSADYYLKRYAGLGMRYHTDMIHDLMDGVRLGDSVLDVGCGTGIIHELYPHLDMTGIDISEGMLKHHKGNHSKASAENIPYASDLFDFIVCRSLLHHLSNPSRGLIEMWRVLKPGGRIALWETNQSLLAGATNKITHHGDRFSEQHHRFRDLSVLVQKYFNVQSVKYQGLVCYGLFGFPDILNFERWIPFKQAMYGATFKLDEVLGKIPGVRRLLMAVQIKAVKV